MIIRSKTTILAAVGVLSVAAAAQLRESAAPEMVGRITEAAQSCSLEFANCKHIVVAAAKDEDWTAWGGAMRGIEK